MSARIVHSQSAEQSRQIACELAVELEYGQVLALYGDLGAGKTVFTQGLCRGLECEQLVNSPSYTLVNNYQGKWPIYHVDCYRLNSAEEINDLDPDRLFEPDGITIIEWAERVEAYLPQNCIRIRIELEDADCRRLEIIRPD